MKSQVFSSLYYFLIFFVVSLSFLVYFSSYRFGSWRFFSVQSGSMEPTLNVGDLIVVQNQSKYQVGDIVSVARENENSLTHRIVTAESGVYSTKGDQNEFIDSQAVSSEQIIGTLRVTIPLLGFVVDYLKTDVGLGLFIITPTAFIIYSELASIKNAVQKERKQKKNVFYF